MRPIPDDAVAELEVVVTPELTVLFDRLGAVHPVYATFRMAQHFEEAGRLLLLRYLEPGEEAVGSALAVEHRAPAGVGTMVRIEARCTAVAGSRVTCACRALDAAGRELGRGSTEQVVLPAEELRARLT